MKAREIKMWSLEILINLSALKTVCYNFKIFYQSLTVTKRGKPVSIDQKTWKKVKAHWYQKKTNKKDNRIKNRKQWLYQKKNKQ